MRNVMVQVVLALLVMLGSAAATDDIRPCLEGASCSFCAGPFTKEDGATTVVPSSVTYWINDTTTTGALLLAPVTVSTPSPEITCTKTGAWGMIAPYESMRWMSGETSLEKSELHVFTYTWPLGTSRRGMVSVPFPMKRQRFSTLPTPTPTP